MSKLVLLFQRFHCFAVFVVEMLAESPSASFETSPPLFLVSFEVRIGAAPTYALNYKACERAVLIV